MNPTVDRDVENLVQVILEYCPNVVVLIRSQRNPVLHNFPTVQLKPLDAADLRTYLLEHERARRDLISASAIDLLLRHTDGIPLLIERSLKDLEVVTLSELVNSDLEVAVFPIAVAERPSALVKSIQALANSSDPVQLRSLTLLKALSLFPQGEQLSRIRRFNATAPFFPAHASELLDQALIEVTTVQGLTAGDSGSLAKTLVVPRPVRELIRDMADSDEVIRMNHRAAEIYFGQQWMTGTFKLPTQYRFDEPHCGSADTANANVIIIRLLREALALENAEQISRVLALAEFYVRTLIRGDHYRSAVSFCDDLVLIIPTSGFEEKSANIQSSHAIGLRMIGEHERCKSTILTIIDYPFSKSACQRILMDLAFCHQSLKQFNDAKQVAEQIIKLDRHSNFGLQARALLIELQTDDPARADKLARMELLCRKEGAEVVANNIALLRAKEAGNDSERIREILLPVVKAPKSKSDFYNRTRAALRLAEISLKNGEKLSDVDLLYLIGAYHYLFNERLSGLFDQCHDCLWKTFETSNDLANLLILFRHSSLYWRLSGRDTKERSYLKKIAKQIGETISEKLSNLGREAAYYLARATTSSQRPATKISEKNTGVS